MMSDIATREPATATEEEQALLRDIKALLDRESSDSAMLLSPSGETVLLPDTAYQLLRQVVQHLARDEAVSVIPISRELTSQQAADLLNVSRPYLIRLLDGGDIPFHRTGTHRRIRLDDLLVYKRKRDAERREGLRQLTRDSQRLGLYGRSKAS